LPAPTQLKIESESSEEELQLPMQKTSEGPVSSSEPPVQRQVFVE
jgi:hypothetical protein